jgi:hypothetical protein
MCCVDKRHPDILPRMALRAAEQFDRSELARRDREGSSVRYEDAMSASMRPQRQ